ncbi:hypothetical protein AQUCO_00700965v1 [Aquilegia coerulea]|uniref:CP12 domain-containing protein n=1 Tax=Aquilegia coerulea TaxID=218851 RepID=A0A2G5EMG4_AQUCA|nr:hypothetical protein AQUCO_00700965v1 [Aquilegia coerulea]
MTTFGHEPEVQNHIQRALVKLSYSSCKQQFNLISCNQMASFPVSNLLSCPKLGSSIRSDDFVKISIPLRNCRNSKSITTVKAMGAVKFKGTQMRERKLTELIEKKILEAKKVCEDDQTSDGCKVAWDEVEEVSQAKADLRRKLEKEDPLEFFCSENPETDECRIYED